MEIKPSTKLNIEELMSATIFLGGSIEQGNCTDWQAEISPVLQEAGWTVLNPRRDNWDATWVQSKSNPQFVEQVHWELQALNYATHALFYFDPATMAPISLYEFGLYCHSEKLTVVCPEGYWRKGNVDVYCDYFDIQQLSSLEEATEFLKAPANVHG